MLVAEAGNFGEKDAKIINRGFDDSNETLGLVMSMSR
jgi:hypothetical protein